MWKLNDILLAWWILEVNYTFLETFVICVVFNSSLEFEHNNLMLWKVRNIIMISSGFCEGVYPKTKWF